MKGTPSKLGSGADALYELRTERLKLEKRVKELKAEEARQSEILIKALQDQNLIGARGSVGTISLQPQTVPTVEDWSKVEDFILKNDCLYLLQRRISNSAYIEFLNQMGGVPGIAPTTLTKLSLRKASHE